MNRQLLLILMGMGIYLVGCAKKPPPEPEPEPIVEPEPIPEPEPEPTGPSPEELLAQRIQELINQILGNRVYFDFDKAELKEEGKTVLAEVGRLLTEEEAGQKITVKIEGHTDYIGTEEYNLALGERRARMVMEYLTTYGVGADRLSIISYGEEQPAVDGEDDYSREQNRRAQFQATADVAMGY